MFNYISGVQIKTGEDPPTGEITISSYSRPNRGKFASDDRNNKVNARLLKLAGQENLPTPTIASKIEEKRGRNKFVTEKVPIESRVHRNFRFEETKHRSTRKFEERKPLAESKRDIDRREKERERNK